MFDCKILGRQTDRFASDCTNWRQIVHFAFSVLSKTYTFLSIKVNIFLIACSRLTQQIGLEVLAEHGITSLALLQKQDPLRIEAVSLFSFSNRNPLNVAPLAVKSPPSFRARGPCVGMGVSSIFIEDI
jgi:hypothetical protein